MMSIVCDEHSIIVSYVTGRRLDNVCTDSTDNSLGLGSGISVRNVGNDYILFTARANVIMSVYVAVVRRAVLMVEHASVRIVANVTDRIRRAGCNAANVGELHAIHSRVMRASRTNFVSVPSNRSTRGILRRKAHDIVAERLKSLGLLISIDLAVNSNLSRVDSRSGIYAGRINRDARCHTRSVGFGMLSLARCRYGNAFKSLPIPFQDVFVAERLYFLVILLLMTYAAFKIRIVARLGAGGSFIWDLNIVVSESLLHHALTVFTYLILGAGSLSIGNVGGDRGRIITSGNSTFLIMGILICHPDQAMLTVALDDLDLGLTRTARSYTGVSKPSVLNTRRLLRLIVYTLIIVVLSLAGIDTRVVNGAAIITNSDSVGLGSTCTL